MLKFSKLTVYYVVFSMVLVFQLFLGQASLGTETSNLSTWAEAEVTAALEKELVPRQLQTNYQANIKRYEYVLLALRVFELSGKNIIIPDNNPFSDTIGHRYELDITKAYNAGIVKGNGNGAFNPDDDITREEISSLIVNLLKQISPDRDFTLKKNYDYSDRNKISEWAQYYIDYCFENNILNGYGGNVMDPKGNATIEQSIALLYRLANNENLLVSEYGAIETIGDYTPTAQIVNQFVENYSIQTFTTIKELSKKKEIGIMSLWEQSITISVNDNTISLNNPDFEKNIYVFIHDPNDALTISSFKQLMDSFEQPEEALPYIDEYLGKMRENEILDVNIQISDNQKFRIRTLSESGPSMSYMMSYIETNE